ncbi:hypothetical protein EDD18DRAFT_1109930 [Armillaria luteobubalina]|uniref:Uncharacterized protein n=1 Tax=Armillaria luteobubalina TaxID=153913 RepID=A0AA39PSK1_9AGAR|nr:hypothetical protein EDD18DRAFT_1109930 [Armillaria luteobubalina]
MPTNQRTKYTRTHAPQPHTPQPAGKIRTTRCEPPNSCQLCRRPTDRIPFKEFRTAFNEHFASKNHELEFLHAQFTGVQCTRYNSLLLTLVNGRDVDESLASRVSSPFYKRFSTMAEASYWSDLLPGHGLMENVTKEPISYNDDLIRTAMSGSVPQAAIMRFFTPEPMPVEPQGHTPSYMVATVG